MYDSPYFCNLTKKQNTETQIKKKKMANGLTPAKAEAGERGATGSGLPPLATSRYARPGCLTHSMQITDSKPY